MGIRIQQLPDVLANQIAAGEVIERPASVVKELLENALDAAADTINIEIDFGGLSQIKISDNGSGIMAEDLTLAISAHATSKIRELNDLFSIRSMGFRGEALASIASISRLTLSSKPAEQEHAMMIRVEGPLVQLLPCARSQGTTVEVRDLFFNAPVRKKFLKTERSEYQAIEAVVKRFALSAPTIGLTLKHNGKPTLILPAALGEKSTVMRIRKLLGKNFLEQAVYIEVERAGMCLSGWVSGAAYQCSQNDKQWVYVNQRMVKDKLINHAIKQAYEGILHPGRYPACLLYLTLPTHELDVNVHPTKHEVRFQQPRLVHDLITTQVTQALNVAPPAPFSSLPEKIFSPNVLRETYIKKPLFAEWVSDSTPSHQWAILNANFAVIFMHSRPFLVDIDRLQRHRLAEILNQHPFPLPSRPLLVPVICAVDNSNYPLFEQMKPQLNELGVDVDLANANKVIVRSVPTLLPHLEIKQFMQNLEKKNNGMKLELLQLLIDSQSMDAHQLSLDEQNELSVFLEENIQKSDLKSCYLPLDIDQCRHMLRLGLVLND